MSKFGFLILLLLIVGCGSPDKENLGQEMQLTFSVDTVLVDPAEEILFLNRWLSQSFLSPDRTYLYNFNAQDYSLEKIDLNQLRLMEKFFFEKEGPNGIGERISTVFQVNSDSLYFGGYNGIGGIYTWEGNKVMDLPLNEWGDSTAQLSSKEQLGGIKGFPNGEMIFYGMVTIFDRDETELATIDVNNADFNRIPLPLMDRTKPFRVTFTDGPAKSSIGPVSYLVTEGKKVILSTAVSNDLYVLDEVGDSLHHFSFDSQIMPIEKEGKYRNEVSSEEEMYAIYRAINEEINYFAPIWDPEKERFYRFSYIGENDSDSEKPIFDVSPDRSIVYLTIYDKNLVQIGESLVPALDRAPARHFAKDGKIWIFENIEDELGFLRLSIDL